VSSRSHGSDMVVDDIADEWTVGWNQNVSDSSPMVTDDIADA
jgi:hypothetical protein